MGEKERSTCLGCSAFLMEPYIRCAKCEPSRVEICLHCFAKGLEGGTHESNHPYEVIRNDFPIFGRGWTAGEEIQLLEGLGDCGMSNWMDISHQMRTKTRQQCEDHYTKYYIESPDPELPELSEPNITYHPSPVVFKLCEDPPRPSENSVMQLEMSGYMSARGDFMTEFDNFAEMDLNDLTFDLEDEEQFDKDLKLAVLEVYMNRLRERDRRKRIIRDYGLINIKKIQVLNRTYEKVLGQNYESMKTLCRLFPPQDFDMYLESIMYEAELKGEILALQEYRSVGITKLQSAKVYSKLKHWREVEKGRRSMLNDVLCHLQDDMACQQWLHRQAALENISKGFPLPLPAAPRRNAPPLDIMALPGFDKLSEKERELCSLVRLVPEAYLEFKHLLITECSRLGYLKLAQARTMIKIDVNKTRKIYDFLVQEAHINKDP